MSPAIPPFLGSSCLTIVSDQGLSGVCTYQLLMKSYIHARYTEVPHHMNIKSCTFVVWNVEQDKGSKVFALLRTFARTRRRQLYVNSVGTRSLKHVPASHQHELGCNKRLVCDVHLAQFRAIQALVCLRNSSVSFVLVMHKRVSDSVEHSWHTDVGGLPVWYVSCYCCLKSCLQ